MLRRKDIAPRPDGKEDWGAEMNSAPQTPHLLFLAIGKRGELRSHQTTAWRLRVWEKPAPISQKSGSPSDFSSNETAVAFRTGRQCGERRGRGTGLAAPGEKRAW